MLGHVLPLPEADLTTANVREMTRGKLICTAHLAGADLSGMDLQRNRTSPTSAGELQGATCATRAAAHR
jgi:hypothetical protein